MNFYSIFIWASVALGIYFLYAFMKGVFSASSDPKPAPKPGPAPAWPQGEKLTAVKIRQTTLELHWPAAEVGSAIKEYVVYQEKVEIGRFPSDELSCKVMKLAAGTEYGFSVVAEDGAGQRSRSLRTKISTTQRDVEKPTWPADAQLKLEHKKTQVKISWSEALDNVGIRKYRVFLNDEIIATPGATERIFSLSRPAPGDYVLRVEAGDAAGNWSKDGPQAALVISEPLLWKHGAALSFSVQGARVVIAWPELSGQPQTYRITAGDGEPIVLDAPRNRYEWTSPGPGMYSVTVEAGDRSGSWSKPLEGQLVIDAADNNAPVWPSNAALIFDRESRVASWPAALDDSSVANYELLLDGEKIAGLPRDTFTYTLTAALAPGLHRIGLMAVDGHGHVSQPLELLFTVEAAPPALPAWPAGATLSLTPTETGVRLEWPAATGEVQRYRIYSGEQLLATIPTPATSYTLSGLAAGKHQLVVQGGNSSGAYTTSGPSASWQQTEADTVKPSWPAGSQLRATVAGRRVQLEWTPATDNVAVVRYVLYLGDAPLRELPVAETTFDTGSLTPGAYEIRIEAVDAAGNISAPGPSASVEIPATLSKPAWNDSSRIVTELEPGNVILKWPTPATDVDRTLKGYRLSRNGIALVVLGAADNTYRLGSVKPGETYVIAVEAQDSSGAWSDPLKATVVIPAATLPVVAPPLNPAKAEPFDKTVDFIYGGPAPQQKGVAPGTIEPKQSCVLKGRVTDASGRALEAVSVSVLLHPEFGISSTDAQGLFNLVVNGGGLLVLRYEASGYLPVQRTTDTAWQEYRWLPGVALTAREPVSGMVNFPTAVGTGIKAGEVSDDHGQRRASVFFPAGTNASVVLPDGKLKPAGQMNFRITEFTSGANGPQAMPGELPPASGYTYAIEITADEAVAKVDGRDIVFDRDVFVCVDNFLGFPVGSPAPAGFFDDQRSTWIPGNDGRVIRVLDLNDGLPGIDSNGKGQPDTPQELAKLGINDEERKHLGVTYAAGSSLWRVPVRHFSIWDFNWPFGPPGDGEPGEVPEPDGDESPEDPCEGTGSIIEYQTQVLGQELPIAGTSFNLCYRSNRVPGHLESRTLDIPVTGTKYPASLKAIDMEVDILGQKTKERLLPSPNLRYRFTWDMKDGFGRSVHGLHPVKVRMGFVYDGVYREPGGGRSFAQPSGVEITGSRTREEVTLWSEWQGSMGLWDSRAMGLGGWTIDAHHFYDPRSKTLYLGDGATKKTGAIGQTISTAVGISGEPGYSGDGGPAAKAHVNTAQVSEVHKDGTVYIADWGNFRIRKLLSDGTIITIAGTGEPGYSGDGGPALKAKFKNVHRVVAAKDGSFFVTDQDNHCIRRIDAAGIVTTFAGNGKPGFSGDGGQATTATLNYPRCLRLASDGTLYFSDTNNHRIRKVTPDGIIVTIAGDGISGYSGDNGPAAKARIDTPQEIFITEDGKVYFSDQGNHCIRCIHPDGAIVTVVGNGSVGYSGDGGKATEAELNSPEGFAIARDGSIYIADRQNYCVRLVTPSGIISTIAGNGEYGYDGDGSSAHEASLREPHAIALGLDGSIYVSDVGSNSIRKIDAPRQLLKAGEVYIPSESGETLYLFDSVGTHQRTLNAFTGKPLLLFSYDKDGLLTEIDYPGNRKMLVVREQQVVRITGSAGIVTALRLQSEGYLADWEETGQLQYAFDYTHGGLMTGLRSASRKLSEYAFDDNGRLIMSADANGRRLTYRNERVENGYRVIMLSPEGEETIYGSIKDDNGQIDKQNTSPSGIRFISKSLPGGKKQMSYADGTTILSELPPSSLSSVGTMTPGVSEIILPSGKRRCFSIERTGDDGDLLTPLLDISFTEIYHAGSEVVTTRYTAAKREIIYEKGGYTMLIRMDNEGRPVFMQTGLLLPILFEWDETGSLAKWSQGERQTQFVYDDLMRLKREISPNGLVNNNEYDQFGRLVSEKNDGEGESSYTYDEDDELRMIALPNGTRHTFDYDAVGSLIKQTATGNDGVVQIISYTDDVKGNVTGVDFGHGLAARYDHNVANQLVDLRTPLRHWTYVYDDASASLLRSKTAEGQDLTFAYDGILLTSLTWSGLLAGRIDFNYDDDFRLLRIDVGNQSIDYGYAENGLMNRVGEATIIPREDFSGHAIEVGVIRLEAEYDEYGDMKTYIVTAGPDEIARFTCQRDLVSRMISETVQLGARETRYAYEYDNAGQLVKQSGDGGTITYAYDINRNRLQRTQDGVVTRYRYNSIDWMLSAADWEFGYNAAGEMISKKNSKTGEEWKYLFDGFGMLTGITMPGGKNISFLSDAEGNRLRKSGSEKSWLYDDFVHPIAELDANGQVETLFVYDGGLGAPLYMVRGGKKYVYVVDLHENVRLVVDADTGAIMQELDYDTFGRITRDTSPGFQPFGFAGGIYDTETGLWYFDSRYYDPETGRWLSPDLAGFEGDGSNLFAYVGNDPVNYIDPIGYGKLFGWVKLLDKMATKKGTGWNFDRAKFEFKKRNKNVNGSKTGMKKLTKRKGAKKSASDKKPEKIKPDSKHLQDRGHKDDDGHTGEEHFHFPDRQHARPKSKKNQKEREKRKDKTKKPHAFPKGSHFGIAIPGGRLGKDMFGDNLAGEAADFFNPLSDIQDALDLLHEMECM